MRSACFLQIKHGSPYYVFWAGCYQRIDCTDNKIRRTKIAGRWANRGEASLTRFQVQLHGDLSAQRVSSLHDGGHKHILYIHGLVQDPSPYMTRRPFTLLSDMLSAVCCGSKRVYNG